MCSFCRGSHRIIAIFPRTMPKVMTTPCWIMLIFPKWPRPRPHPRPISPKATTPTYDHAHEGEGQKNRENFSKNYFFQIRANFLKNNSKNFLRGRGIFFSKSYFLMNRISIGSFLILGILGIFGQNFSILIFLEIFRNSRISLKIGPMTQYGRLISKIIISRIHREGEERS